MNLVEKFQATMSRGNMLQAQASQLELQLQATKTELAKCQGQVDLLLELDPSLPQKASAQSSAAAAVPSSDAQAVKTGEQQEGQTDA